MIRNYTIVRQIPIPTSINICWKFLSEPELIREWFADVKGQLVTGGSFEFHFGDGDFFKGTVHFVDEPVSLRFSWRFMGAGERSELEYALIPQGEQKTLVTIIDRSEHSETGVLEMCEGWDDFLARLERRVRTGENSRYQWSESIGCGAVVPMPVVEARMLLQRPDVWSDFREFQPLLQEAHEKLVVTMNHPSWDGHVTTAAIGFRQRGTSAYVSVNHQGFDQLPKAIQFTERKLLAGLWASFLTRLEITNSPVSELISVSN